MVVQPRFKMGEIVWAKVGSNPWWPGQVYSEALASSEVKKAKIDGYLLVSFFGDDTYAWFDAKDLLPFKPNFIKKAKEVLCHREPLLEQPKSRVEHLKFETAIKHSLEEWRRRGEIGLACSCEKNYKFITCNKDPNFYDVQIAEGANEFCYFGKFSKKIIKEERENIRPEDDVLSFIQDLAVRPYGDVFPMEDRVDWIKKSREDDQHLDFIRRKGIVIGYRREWFGPESNSYELLVEAFQELRDEEFDLSPPHEDPNSAKSKRIVKPLVNKKTCPKEPKERKHLIKQSGKLPTSRFIENEHRIIHGGSNKKAHKKNGAIVSTELATERPCLNESNLKRRKKEQTETSADTNRNVGKTGRDESKPSAKKYRSLNSIMASEEEKAKRAPTPKEYEDYRSLNSNKASKEKNKARRALSPKESEDYMSLNSIMVSEDEEEAKRALTPKKYVDSSAASSSQPLNPFVQLLKELRALAADPRAVVDQSTITTVSKVFEQFRSLTYRKSSANELARKAALYSSNLMKPPSMNESNLKRQHTDQVDEITAKKLKRPIVESGSKANVSENNEVAEIKTKTTKKSPPLNDKGTISGLKRQKPDCLDENTKKVRRSNITKDTEATVSQPQNAAVKSEPRPITLTNLILQFPPNSKLPTVAELKLKFIRFGPIIVDKIYVSWYSYTCTVLFKYKSDAEVAQRSKEHHKFGRTEALYAYISECREPENLQAPKQQPEENSRQIQVQVQIQQKSQLKPCLKKPIERSASNGSAACVTLASEKEIAEKEFSARMLTLMRQCSEIVNAVKATFGGYIPYHHFWRTVEI